MVKFLGFLAINGEVDTGIICPRWLEELLQGGIWILRLVRVQLLTEDWGAMHHFGSTWTSGAFSPLSMLASLSFGAELPQAFIC